jgi:hypothetical protein
VRWMRVAVPLLVALPLLLSAVIAYQMYNQLRGRDEAVKIAESHLLTCETFRFDGIKSSVTVDTVVSVQSGWRIRLNFSCAHPGYGDRTGQLLLQVISPHQIQITVQEGKVSSAIIDEKRG